MSIIKWLLFLPTNLFGGALAVLLSPFAACLSMRGKWLPYWLRRYAGAKYDWFSLLAFILPGRHWRDSSRLYCFELPAEVLGMSVKRRITPERLLDMTLHLIKVAK